MLSLLTILLFIILIVLNILDLLTTKYALNLGGREANPIARFFLLKLGFRGLVFFKILFFPIIVYLFLTLEISNSGLLFVNAIFVLILNHNFLTIKRLLTIRLLDGKLKKLSKKIK